MYTILSAKYFADIKLQRLIVNKSKQIVNLFLIIQSYCNFQQKILMFLIIVLS